MQWIIIMIYYDSKPCWKTLLSPQILFCYLVPFVFFPIVDDFFKKRDWILKRHPGFKWVSSIVNWIRRDCIQTLNLAKKTNQCCGARKTDRTLNWDFSSFPCVQLRSIVIVWSKRNPSFSLLNNRGRKIMRGSISDETTKRLLQHT